MSVSDTHREERRRSDPKNQPIEGIEKRVKKITLLAAKPYYRS
jgi:hypothetical protein